MNESKNWGYHRRHYFGWFILAFALAAITIVGLSVYFFATRIATTFPAPGYPSPFFFFPFGLIFGVFFIFIIFGAIRWVFWPRTGWGYGYGYRGRYGGYSNEYHILRQRYARGEITKEQFEQMTNDLRQHTAANPDSAQ